MSDVRYYHIRTGGGVVTCCVRRNVQESTSELGFAMCSPKDQFNRKIGRTIALGRLNKHPIVVKHSGSSLEDARSYIVKNIDFFPSWVVCW